MAFRLLFFAILFVCQGGSLATHGPNLDRRQDATLNSPPGGTNSSSSGKAGLGWANGNSVDIRQFAATGKVTWYYTWSAWPVGNSRTSVDLEFVPMLWGDRTLGDFTSTINDTIRRSNSTSNNITTILGMNEPDQSGQSNLTAEAGAQLWLSNIEPFHARGLRLGSPAVSSAPAGKTWLQDFFTECDGKCTVDFVALHWYGTNADDFIAYLYDYWYAFNRTLWVTEWACQNFVSLNDQCTDEDVVAFLNKTQTFMDSSDFVERYAWFGAMSNLQGMNPDNALLDSHGDVTPLGRQYINATSDQSLESSASICGPLMWELYTSLLIPLLLGITLS